MGGVAVEPAHVALVDCFDVVADGAVVAAGMPALGQGVWELEVFCDFDACEAVVDHAEGLVVKVGVEITLL